MRENQFHVPGTELAAVPGRGYHCETFACTTKPSLLTRFSFALEQSGSVLCHRHHGIFRW